MNHPATVPSGPVTQFFTVEVPSQRPHNSRDGKKQHKAEQHGWLSLSTAKIADSPYPGMDDDKVNGR